MQHKSAITSKLLGGGLEHKMALFTLLRFLKCFPCAELKHFFKHFASQERSVDGIHVSFSRNGTGEQVECHCHLLAKGDVAFQWVVSLVLDWGLVLLGFFLVAFLFLFPFPIPFPFSFSFPSFNTGETL